VKRRRAWKKQKRI